MPRNRYILAVVDRENTSLPVPCLQKGRPWGHLLFLLVKNELFSLDLFDTKSSSKSSDKSAVAIVENAFILIATAAAVVL